MLVYSPLQPISGVLARKTAEADEKFVARKYSWAKVIVKVPIFFFFYGQFPSLFMCQA